MNRTELSKLHINQPITFVTASKELRPGLIVRTNSEQGSINCVVFHDAEPPVQIQRNVQYSLEPRENTWHYPLETEQAQAAGSQR